MRTHRNNNTEIPEGLPVRIFNISAKNIKIRRNSTLSELQEVKILRNAQETANKDHFAVSTQISVKECKRTDLPEGVALDFSILNSKQTEMAANLFHRWNNILSKGITDIGHTDLVKQRIKLGKENPLNNLKEENHLVL